MSDESLLNVTDENFEDEVIGSELPVLVDFWAVWCGPCRMVAPFVEQIAEEYKDRLKVAKLNVDENQAVPAKYGIMSIPTLLYFKDGVLVDKTLGALPKAAIEARLARLA